MGDSDLLQLYSGRILALAADIPHLGRLPEPDGSARRRSPTCGSSVTVDLAVTDGRITEFAQEVKACALGQASAAILGRVVIGLDAAALDLARRSVTAMLQEDGPPPAAPFQDYEVLIPARGYRNRHASILLVLDAAAEAMAQATARTAQ